MAYYLPEGYFGPVCDVPMAADDVPFDLALPPTEVDECIVNAFCADPEFDDVPWDPPTFFCRRDDSVSGGLTRFMF